MRPKLLEIKGLQSFRETQIIDFEKLGENGLFGIFGPTGSGKSTILDAITLALYGAVKRAERGTQGIMNANMNEASVLFTFELLKNGERKIYRAERSYRRKKGSDNSCESRITRLVEVTEAGEIPVGDRRREINDSIVELLGLSHEDFTRAVVLPQNSFQEFLQLGNADRKKMLERIFYLEEYGEKLRNRVKSKMDRVISKINALHGELRGYADASEDALQKSREEMEKAAAERKKAEEDFKCLETKCKEAEEVWKHTQDLMQINQAESELLAVKDSINEKREALEKAKKADMLLESIKSVKELADNLAATEKKLEQVQKLHQDVIAELIEAQRRHDETNSELNIERPKLISRKTMLDSALGIKREVCELQKNLTSKCDEETKLRNSLSDLVAQRDKEIIDLNELKNKFNSLNEEIRGLSVEPEYRVKIREGDELEKEVRSLKENLTEHMSNLHKLQTAISELEQKQKCVEDEISAYQISLELIAEEKKNHEETMPEDRSSIQDYKDRINDIQKVFNVLNIISGDLRAIDSKISVQDLQLEEFKIRLIEKEEACERCKIIFEQCRQEHENSVAELSKNTAFILSKELKKGKPCPVCGSEHHPCPAFQAEVATFAEVELRAKLAKEKLIESEKNFKEVEQETLTLREQANSLTGKIAETKQERDLKEAQYNTEKFALREELQDLDLKQLAVEIEKMNTLSSGMQKAIEDWEEKQAGYKDKTLEINDAINKKQLVRQDILAQLKVKKEDSAKLDEILSAGKTKLAERERQHMDFLSVYNIESASSEIKRLQDNDSKSSRLQKESHGSNELIEKKQKLIDESSDEINKLSGDKKTIDANIASLISQISDGETKIREISGDSVIEDEIMRTDDKLKEYEVSERQCKDRLIDAENRRNELAIQESELLKQRDIYSENLGKGENKLRSDLKEKGFSVIDEAEKAVITKESQIALTDEVNDYDKEDVKIKAQKAMVLEKLDSRSISFEKWNQISEDYDKMASHKENCVANSEVLKEKFSTLQKKHAIWLELNKECTEWSKKQGLYEQIFKLLQADRGRDNSFIDYIAEERLRYVALKASETLGIMTKFKYALELDADSGFIIRDNANGGIRRMVTSLSGGETFLTSLSLALALSEQIQLKGQSPLEFFFLDEGFGTLDSNLLDTVIDSLERLSKKERVIGLISHVPELRSRIARRLIVSPPSLQGGGSTVSIERG